MPTLRALSWNLRTFGSAYVSGPKLQKIADIILASQADVVCIQEVMIGDGVTGEVGAPISAASIALINRLNTALQTGDPGAGWACAVSGVDSGVSDHMRDAHAFFWKTVPGKTKFAHSDPVDAVELLIEPVILRQEGQDNFPGRRPGMVTLGITAGKNWFPLNVISYHAPTPCNRFSKGIGSGYGINSLATLPEIGGGMQYGTGWNWTYVDSGVPLPQIDTIIAGDFNYTMDDKWAQFTYNNLLTNYQGCVSTPGNVAYTTYGPDATQAFRLVSAYDNIFALQPHDGFKPALTFAKNSGTIDFILADSKLLGQAIGVLEVGTQAAWFVIHRDLYNRQHAAEGLSDHLPVWADFTIGVSTSSAANILPTAGSNNNCLFHALYGTLTNGFYVDATAAQRRTNLAATLQGYATAGAFPTGANLTGVRNAILASMINDFDQFPATRTLLQLLLANNTNPFTVPAFAFWYGQYIGNITGGRMLYVHEAELIACIDDVTVVLHYVDRGQNYSTTFNQGQMQDIPIYHQALHFSRYNAGA
jgi:endonuclease/exonuclease/phosphatase family metal-dependent hydrolase